MTPVSSDEKGGRHGRADGTGSTAPSTVAEANEGQEADVSGRNLTNDSDDVIVEEFDCHLVKPSGAK